MIIFGWRGVTLGGKTGQFYCPECKTDRSYQKKKVQRFFTLFFIPLIPLEVLQESVECQTCRKRWKPNVLTQDPRAEQKARNEQLGAYFRIVLLHFAAMSSRRDYPFLQQLTNLYAGFNGGAITAEDVGRGLEQPPNNFVPAAQDLAKNLTDRGREIVVKAALDAATADGTLTEDKRAALTELARLIGMSDVHVLGVLTAWTPPIADAAPPAAAALN